MLDRAELRRVHFHVREPAGPRRGSRLPTFGTNLATASIQVTGDTYGHPVPGAKREAVDRLDDTETMRNLRNLK